MFTPSLSALFRRDAAHIRRYISTVGFILSLGGSTLSLAGSILPQRGSIGDFAAMTTQSLPAPTLQARQVYTLAAICLLVGLAIGYVVRGSQPATSTARAAVAANAAVAKPALPPGHPTGNRPSLEDLKRMADSKAAPLLEKLKSEPSNTALLVQIGGVYHGTHQFTQAATYYDKAVQLEPKNAAFRIKLASSLYRSGNIDAATAQLNQALSIDPKNANALFDLGMIRLQGKQDTAGAIAAWRQLLKNNPQLGPDKKALVEHMIATAQSAAAAHRSTAQ